MRGCSPAQNPVRATGVVVSSSPVSLVVQVGSILHGYTGGSDQVPARGCTLDGLLRDLDRQHPGLRFRLVDELGRLRPHINVFLDGERVRDLDRPLVASSRVAILGALSGG